MKSVFGYFRDLLGYTRRERRSSFILLFLVVVSLLLRFLIPESSITVEATTLSYRTGINSLLSGESRITDEAGIAEQQTKGSDKHIISGQFEQTKASSFQWNIPELNSCDSLSLEALPGLGPVLSARIIKFRELLGGFYSVEQLREVYGLPEETFNLVCEMVVVDTTKIQMININEADYVSLIRMPYLSKEEVNNILRYRTISGIINSMDELVDNGVLGEQTAKIVIHYIEFSGLSEEKD